MSRRPYFGYYVVAALFFAEIAVTGISFYSFSLFIRAWQADPSLNWTLTEINSAFLIAVPLAAASPFIGRLVDTRGPKLVMLMGIPLIALSFGLRGFMTEIWHLWAIQGLLVLGQSAAFLGTGKLVGLWFSRDRGRMMGIALAGNNAGGMIMAPLSAYLLEGIGWRDTFIIYGIGLIIVNMLLILVFVRDKPSEVIKEARRVGRDQEVATAERLLEHATVSSQTRREPGVQPSGEITRWQDGVRTLTFWLIAISFLASFASIFAVLNQLGKHLDIAGIDIQTTGQALGLLGLFGLIGKVLFGYVSERIASRYSFAIVSVLQIGGIMMLLFVQSPGDAWILWPFVFVYGVGFGAVGALMPLVITETFGILAYGTIFGVMQAILRVGNGGLPPIVGYSVDASGTYTVAFSATIVALIVGGTAIVFARPRATSRVS